MIVINVQVEIPVNIQQRIGHVFNSDKDCYDVCFGLNKPPCYINVDSNNFSIILIPNVSNTDNIEISFKLKIFGNSVFRITHTTFQPSEQPFLLFFIDYVVSNVTLLSYQLPNDQLNFNISDNYYIRLRLTTNSYFNNKIGYPYPWKHGEITFSVPQNSIRHIIPVDIEIYYQMCQTLTQFDLCSLLPGCFICIYNTGFNSIDSLTRSYAYPRECRSGFSNGICLKENSNFRSNPLLFSFLLVVMCII